ncbi:MAG TPA: EAL domain-containing protein [Gemmatimonadaceae bacterium]|nr:EAL domain-containing protein [Gemmatimonadaceae bacterium]
MRDTRRIVTTPVVSGHGRLYMWFPDIPSQAKVVQYLTRQEFTHQLSDGNCLLVDGEWERLRDMAIPLRRVLTQFEADDLRVLFKPDGGELTTADFPRVHSFTQFSLISQSSWLHDLLDDSRLTTVFQKIVPTNAPSATFANEALMRGLARNGVVLYPGYILDVARACNMLTQVDHAARVAAIAALVRGDIAEKVFINISPGTVHDPIEAVDTTSMVVRDAGIPHDRVVFEVTEADQTLDPGMLRRLLMAYRDAGFGVALDDVGSGYSSLNLLHQLRPDYIKIDMELIRGVHTDGYKALIAQKIIEIARSLNVKTIAEGIETPEELDWVQTHGADYAQGYLISKPTEPRFLAAR